MRLTMMNDHECSDGRDNNNQNGRDDGSWGAWNKKANWLNEQIEVAAPTHLNRSTNSNGGVGIL